MYRKLFVFIIIFLSSWQLFSQRFADYFFLQVGAGYDLFSTEFKTPKLEQYNYNFNTGYTTRNMLLDISLTTPLGVINRKFSDNYFKDLDGDQLTQDIVRRSGFGNLKHNVLKYSPMGLSSFVNWIFNRKYNSLDFADKFTLDMILPDYKREVLEGANLKLTKTEMFGLYGVTGYSRTQFSSTNELGQTMEGDISKFVLISMENVIRRSWTEGMFYIGTYVAKQSGDSYEDYLRSLNESTFAFPWMILLPMPILELYVVSETVTIKDNFNNIIYQPDPIKRGIGYNVGLGYLKHIAIPSWRMLIIPSAYYHFVDIGGKKDKDNPEIYHYQLINQKGRYNVSLSIQMCF